MLEIVMRFILVASAILVPLLILAGVVWVIMRPISLEDVQRRHAGAARTQESAGREMVAPERERADSPRPAA